MPSSAEEEACKVNNTSRVKTQELIEIGPPLIFDLNILEEDILLQFFPSKAKEEACKVNNTPHVVTRELVEIRDLYPAPKVDLQKPMADQEKDYP
ncbi:hypothetical protein H5410_051797 [Solanum commersonii]|uniref:Uncharacterized protein n=1 Tax=Solanum commersonii TaxID=4109 RepID=A0A9J5WZI4_SOLCO|nr:hypothetical protein H5410_051797 [Solanum commersonii]